MIRRCWIFVLLFCVTSLVGCAKQPLVLPEKPAYFPGPPEPPKIVYERSLYGPLNFMKVSFVDRMFGFGVSNMIEKPIDVYATGDRVYIADTGRNQVHIMDFAKDKALSLGASGTGKLRQPMGVRGTADGNIYVSDALLKAILVYDAEGKYTRSIGKQGDLVNPTGIAISEELGRIYVTDSKAHAVKVFSLQGEPLFSFGQGGDGDGMFFFPSFLCIDRRTGEVYVSDSNNFRVQVFDRDGQFIRKFGDLGDAPGFFQRPKGVGVDSDGNAYVAEAVFNNFQIFNDKGEVLTWIGQGGRRGPGVFLSPGGLYIDENDKVYVVDVLNKRVQQFQYLSEKWKKDHPELWKEYQERK